MLIFFCGDFFKKFFLTFKDMKNNCSFRYQSSFSEGPDGVNSFFVLINVYKFFVVLIVSFNFTVL